MFIVGVFRDGKLLFTLCSAQPTYARAALACELCALADLPLKTGDYIACEHVSAIRYA